MPCVIIPDGILCLGNPTLKLGDIYFEMHDYCGPMRCTKLGDGSAQDFPSNFWPKFQKWSDGGKKVDEENNAIY